MTSSKPTIVLVPGAWHSSTHYNTLTTLLQAAKYPVICYPLPSFDADDSTPYGDIAFVRNKMIMPSLDKGKDVVVMAHCYGGYPAGAASNCISKQERMKKGEKGGVIGFIWITALTVQKEEGEDLKDRIPDKKFPKWFIVDEDVGRFMIAKPKEKLYNDVTPAIAIDAMVGLRPMACNTYTTTVETSPGWEECYYNNRRHFVVCTKDEAITKKMQEHSVEDLKYPWSSEELESGHCPFLSMPKDLSEKIDVKVSEWVEAEVVAAAKAAAAAAVAAAEAAAAAANQKAEKAKAEVE